MRHPNKRRKRTREEKAKRNAKKARRREDVNNMVRAVERVREAKKRADRAGIVLPDSQDTRRYGRDRSDQG